MKKTVEVVIGANYGDEGKGRTVAFLAGRARPDAKVAVVRFNGGAQAGHTVVHDKHRHVFSHFGSATFAGVPTILTADFVCCPSLFIKEYVELKNKTEINWTFVDYNCLITTPWDIAMNQLVERHRGKDRHGSVGVGFNETIHRSEFNGGEFALYAGNITNGNIYVRTIAETIKNFYVPWRLTELGIDITQYPDFEQFFASTAVLDRFCEECKTFGDLAVICYATDKIDQHDHLIFEGAQGLALDQNAEGFPHVTRSYTGIENVLKACALAGITEGLDVTYVTRPYLTRHGAGPLPNEKESLDEHFNIVDETNKPHEFQGSLRFAYLEVDQMTTRIFKDIDTEASCEIERLGEVNLMMTCMDQVKGNIPCYIDGELQEFFHTDLPFRLSEELFTDHMFLAFGEKPNDVEEL